MSPQIVRIPLLLLLALLLSSVALAAPNWDAYYQSLDSFDYAKARRLAQAFPAGGARELALAQLDIAELRPDRTYRVTDKLSLEELPRDLWPLYLLIRAHQERYAFYAVADEQKRAIERLVNEGLRQPGMRPRDRADLLLFRIQLGQDDTQREAALAELAALPGIDPALVLQGQASLAIRQKRSEQAASLWAVLAENARLRGQKRAALIFSASALGAGETLDAARLAPAQNLLRRALQSKDTWAVLQAWNSLGRRVPKAQSAVLYEQVAAALPSLPSSDEKLLLMLTLSYNGPEPRRAQIEREGLQLAVLRKDGFMQVNFLFGLKRSSKDPAAAQAASARLDALLETVDTRGSYTRFKAPPPGGKSQAPSTREGFTLQDLAADLEALDPALGEKERIFVYGRFARRGMQTGNYALAEVSFLRGLDEALRLPGVDQLNALYWLVGDFTMWANIHRPADINTLEGDLAGVALKALGEKLRGRRALMARLVGARIALKPEWRLGELYSANLAAVLCLLGRHDEALEILLATQPVETLENDQMMLLVDIGGAMLEMGNPEGLEMLRQGLQAAQPGEARTYATLGWEALKLGQLEQAEEWSRQALEAPAKSSLPDLLKAQVYQLRAITLARLGRPEEGLQALEDGQAAASAAGLAVDGYSPVKADMLLRLGRAEEAAAVLAQSPLTVMGKSSLYDLNVRRRVAAAAHDAKMSEQLESVVTAFLASPGAMPDDPFVGARLAAALGRPVRVVAPVEERVSFTEVAEGLERLRRREPENTDLARLAMADIKRLSRDCAEDEVVVMPASLRHSLVFVVLGQGRVDLLEVVCMRDHLLKASAGLLSVLSTPDSQPEAQRAEWDYLSSRLVRPWRELYPQARRLRWLAPPELARLPLCVLPDGDKLLRDTMAVAVLDGPALPEVVLDRSARALLVGGASDLTGSARELEEVRALFPEGATWTLDGSVSVLQEELSKSHLLHISTHAAVPSAKSLSGTLRGDGASLSAFQLSELVFPAGSLAVVAACQSAVDAGTGRDNTSLVSALRTAGAGAVVGSLWELDDQATAELVEHFYRRVREGQPPDAALAEAQAETARKWPHPFYWAGLQVVSGP